MDIAALQAAGFDVTPEMHARLARFIELLLDENSRTNLTAIRSAEKAWVLHICDSLAVRPLLEVDPLPERVLDVGTGPGLPGIPLAIALPDVQFTLLDATRKKVAAVERMVAALELTNVTPLWGRAEEHAHDPKLREQFDLVTSRAVGGLAHLCEFATGFLSVGGQALFMKSVDGAREEVDQAIQSARVCGLESVGYSSYTLPGDYGERVVVVYRKATPLSPKLPRPPSARKHPL